MARLGPKVTPFRVLKTTEGIESLPGMLAFIAGIFAFALRLAPLEIGAAVAAAQIIGKLINLVGFYVVPGLITISTFFSYVSGWGIFLIISVVAGLIFVGWQGSVAYLLGWLSAGIVNLFLDSWGGARFSKLAGHPFSMAELHFFSAYRIHATQLGITTDIDLAEVELEEENWGPTFREFEEQWPEVVARFTID
jgi:hypothetical protein